MGRDASGVGRGCVACAPAHEARYTNVLLRAESEAEEEGEEAEEAGDEEDFAADAEEARLEPPPELQDGMSSVVTGIATPDVVNLRKQR